MLAASYHLPISRHQRRQSTQTSLKMSARLQPRQRGTQRGCYKISDRHRRRRLLQHPSSWLQSALTCHKHQPLAIRHCSRIRCQTKTPRLYLMTLDQRLQHAATAWSRTHESDSLDNPNSHSIGSWKLLKDLIKLSSTCKLR
jgi:hypothetical protein